MVRQLRLERGGPWWGWSCLSSSESWASIYNALCELGEPRAGGGTELSHRSLSSHLAICVKHTHMVMFYSNFLKSGANTEACRLTCFSVFFLDTSLF